MLKLSQLTGERNMNTKESGKFGPRAITYPHPIERSEYDWPTFSKEEFQRRHQLVRSFMEANDLDCLLIAGNSAISTQQRGG